MRRRTQDEREPERAEQAPGAPAAAPSAALIARLQQTAGNQAVTALLARQPAIRPWRIGHFERRMPDGYLESIRSGNNQVADFTIARQYEQLKLVTQGPIWSRRRWRAIRRLNLDW